MSCVKVGQIWKNLIGEGHEFIVESVTEDGWANGRRVRDGTKEPMNGTGFAAFHETMEKTMKRLS